MKKLLRLTVLLLLCVNVFAQPKQPVKSTSPDIVFGESLNKVILDFTFNFKNIQGSRMPAEIDADTYRSTVCIPGALVCKVMRYHSVEDKTASWQAVAFAGESFDEALKIYKKLFGQVKKIPVKGVDAAACHFDGFLEEVDENVGFAVSPLWLKTKSPRYQDFAADVEMVSGYTGWEVRLNIYTKKRTEATEAQ